mmetsp:Transcript_12896/g.12787  ORF Transcript_12896/g.12787 Transcript_12896/m.12787 type:complete len:120 (+) Transcript_12896:1-360(+)
MESKEEGIKNIGLYLLQTFQSCEKNQANFNKKHVLEELFSNLTNTMHPRVKEDLIQLGADVEYQYYYQGLDWYLKRQPLEREMLEQASFAFTGFTTFNKLFALLFYKKYLGEEEIKADE